MEHNSDSETARHQHLASVLVMTASVAIGCHAALQLRVNYIPYASCYVRTVHARRPAKHTPKSTTAFSLITEGWSSCTPEGYDFILLPLYHLPNDIPSTQQCPLWFQWHTAQFHSMGRGMFHCLLTLIFNFQLCFNLQLLYYI